GDLFLKGGDRGLGLRQGYVDGVNAFLVVLQHQNHALRRVWTNANADFGGPYRRCHLGHGRSSPRRSVRKCQSSTGGTRAISTKHFRLAREGARFRPQGWSKESRPKAA